MTKSEFLITLATNLNRRKLDNVWNRVSTYQFVVPYQYLDEILKARDDVFRLAFIERAWDFYNSSTAGKENTE